MTHIKNPPAKEGFEENLFVSKLWANLNRAPRI